MPDTSRYGIANDDLRIAALALQIGEGMADRFKTAETLAYILDSEDWAENQVDEFIATPLKPVRKPGDVKGTNPVNPTARNYPHDFIKAIIYRAVGLLLHSEFFEQQPTISESGKWALDEADRHIQNFKDKTTTNVGAGRRRNVNCFMPPNIAPRQPRTAQGV